MANFVVTRRKRVIVAWVAALALIAGLTPMIAGDWEADYNTPGSESALAATAISDHFGDEGSGDTIDVVWEAPGGVNDPSTRATVNQYLQEAEGLEGIAGAERVRTSADGTIGMTSFQLDRRDWDVPVESADTLIDRAEAISGDGLRVELAGGIIQEARSETSAEMFGMAAALVILLIAFGSLVAAGLPLLTALFGLGTASALIGVLAAALPVPDWATAVTALIGIALGIDYSLLILTRFRSELGANGDGDRREAIVTALSTAGRSVLVAGTTVIVALGGLLLMRLSFMTGVAFAAMIAVLVAMISALTLVPALLAVLGHRVDRLRIPGLRGGAWGETGPVAARWSRAVQRRPWTAAIAGTAVLVALALPVMDMRFGFPDFGSDPEGTTTREAHDLAAEGFGEGAVGPLLIVAEGSGSAGALESAAERVRNTNGVASVDGPVPAPDGEAALLTATPASSAQSQESEDLVQALRDDVLPAAVPDSGVDVHVGGLTASFIDQSDLMASRLPVFIGGVVLISLLLLLVAFRAPLVALKAGIVNLLSVGAAYGIVALASGGGGFGELVGIDTEVPVPPFIPVMMFAILFGLSMDYEVFLLSRIREQFLRHGDSTRAVTEGLARTARVITAAAAIMVAVFCGFLFSPEVFLKQMGIGMAAAIAIDATIVRMVLVPAVMQLLGKNNWWLPSWLDRSLPSLDLERREPRPAYSGQVAVETE
jgi:RND superfamily putative drug exporter